MCNFVAEMNGMGTMNDGIEELWVLCVKYRRVLEVECAWQMDTLLGVVWNDYCTGRGGGVWAKEEIRRQAKDDDVDMLLEELRIVYERLEERGISREMARQMLWEKEHVSRLEVGRGCVVSLIDLGIEVRLSPLQWALYVLFLRHDKGIIYKQLPDYRDELMEIMMSGYDDDALVNVKRMRGMIERVTDPTKGGINETVSKIRRAFSDALGSEDAARHYCICGARNSVHRISLSREYVCNFEAIKAVL